MMALYRSPEAIALITFHKKKSFRLGFFFLFLALAAPKRGQTILYEQI
jgi:hypothetical protein